MTTIEAADFALLRRPLLSMATFTGWKAAADPEQFLIDQFNHPLLNEGVYIANPALHARLCQLRGQGQDQGQSLSGIERRGAIVSLAKFLSRAAYRCTPFGTFAQIQFAHVGAAAADDALPSIRRGIHLDAGVEAALLEEALKDRGWRATLRWQISTTAHVLGDQMSYVDWVYRDDGQRSYRAVELAMNEGLELLVKHCQEAQHFHELCACLEIQLAVSTEEAHAFLHETIDRRLLLPHLAPTAGSGCSLDHLVAASAPHPATATLRAIADELAGARKQAASASSLLPRYAAIQSIVEADIGAARLTHGAIQVDTVIDARAALDPALTTRIASAAQLLARHTARRRTSLDAYKRLFRERFEDREVNLAYALHSELGLPFPSKGGLGSPLLDGLKLGAPAATEAMAPALNAFDRLLVERLFAAAGTGQSAIVISVDDLAGLATPAQSADVLAEGLYAHVSVLPAPDGSGPAIELHAMDGRSGQEMMARFCHLSEPLRAAASIHNKAVTDADTGPIYAEIIHHPQDRLLNILRRPRLATHDIVFAGASDLPRTQQFWLEDLTVQLAGERFILRDRRSGRQVIARLTSAHNYAAKQLGTYQFLCHLQDDDAAWIGFHWPGAVQDLPRLPRVEVAGLIVARARWRLMKADIDALNQALVESTMEDWRLARALPRFVTFDQGDNRLPIDLHNPASSMLLLDQIIKLDTATVHECLALNLALEHGRFEQHNQELVVPLRPVRTPAATPAQAPLSQSSKQLQREGQVCAALGEWAYLRIYTGSAHADRVLREAVMPVLKAAIGNNDIDRWFFVRYQDSFEHLRVRFHSQKPANVVATLTALHSALEQARNQALLWRVVSDHYVPETERYGGTRALTICEQLFCIDSDDLSVLLDIEAAASEGDTPPRWLFALASLDAYARILCPDRQQRDSLLDTLANRFLREQAPGAARSQALVALGARFRELRKEVDSLQHDSGSLAQWRNHLHSRSQDRAALVATLPQDGSIDAIRHSLLHMHLNRLAPSEPRKHETVLYDFARRLERARQAKQRSAAETTA